MPFFSSLASLFGRVALVVGPLSNTGSSDVFVVNYDPSGTPLWARRLGGTLGDVGNSVSVDSSGNVIVVGTYASSPLNIYAADGTTVSFTLSQVGNGDTFVVKYNSGGTPLWARKIGGTGDDRAQSVSVDSSGNIVVAGQYDSTTLNIYAADGTTVSFTLTPNGGTDGFVVKYDSSGTPVWARKIAGTGTDAARTFIDIAQSVTIDSSGNVIVCGNYNSVQLNIYAANGTTVAFQLANTGSDDIFVVKYDSSGTFIWARRIGGTDSDLGNSVSVDSSGNIVVAGSYASSPVNIYAANGTTVSFSFTNSGVGDFFIVKYDSNGTPLWARKAASTNFDSVSSVSIDSSGNVIVFGRYSAALQIYAADGTTITSSLSGAGGFVLKYDSSGTFIWARRLGAVTVSSRSVTTDSSGNVIAGGGYASSSLSMYAANGSTVSFTLTNTGSNDTFVVKYDSSGTPLWAKRMTGTLSDQANSVTIDSSGNIVVAGNYLSTSLNFY
jgi:hypothetical protein